MNADSPVQIDAYGLTHAGNVRPVNEDHFVVGAMRKSVEMRLTSLVELTSSERLKGAEANLFVVADGVGGQRGGALASRAAVRSLVEYIAEAVGCFQKSNVDEEHEFIAELERGVAHAHAHLVRELGGGEGGPATTLTMVTLVWPRAYIVHVGDSRAYYLRGGRLRRLTRDQTLGAYMVDEGAWTEEQASRARIASNLASAVGGSEMTPSVGLVDLQPGDTLLLCTDGLTKHVPDERITEVLGRHAAAEPVCRELVAAALQDGGSDNVTVIVARMGTG